MLVYSVNKLAKRVIILKIIIKEVDSKEVQIRLFSLFINSYI